MKDLLKDARKKLENLKEQDKIIETKIKNNTLK